MPIFEINGSLIVAVKAPALGPEDFVRTTVLIRRDGQTIVAQRWDDRHVEGPVTDLEALLKSNGATLLPVQMKAPAGGCVAWLLRPSMDTFGEYGARGLRVSTRHAHPPLLDVKTSGTRIMLIRSAHDKHPRAIWADKVAALGASIRETDPARAQLMLRRAIQVTSDKENRAAYQAVLVQLT